MVSLASRRSFFLAPKVGIPISFSSSSVRVAKVGRSISWRTNMSAYLRSSGEVCSRNLNPVKIKLNMRLISHGQIGVEGMVLINDSLGESLVGEKNWQTISNILLTIVLSPIPGEVQVKKIVS